MGKTRRSWSPHIALLGPIVTSWETSSAPVSTARRDRPLEPRAPSRFTQARLGAPGSRVSVLRGPSPLVSRLSRPGPGDDSRGARAGTSARASLQRGPRSRLYGLASPVPPRGTAGSGTGRRKPRIRHRATEPLLLVPRNDLSGLGTCRAGTGRRRSRPDSRRHRCLPRDKCDRGAAVLAGTRGGRVPDGGASSGRASRDRRRAGGSRAAGLALL